MHYTHMGPITPAYPEPVAVDILGSRHTCNDNMHLYIHTDANDLHKKNHFGHVIHI